MCVDCILLDHSRERDLSLVLCVFVYSMYEGWGGGIVTPFPYSISRVPNCSDSKQQNKQVDITESWRKVEKQRAAGYMLTLSHSEIPFFLLF